MKVLNQHTRIIDQPINEIWKLMETLSTKNDRIWPSDKWSAMKFKDGLREGAKGGHGIIRYIVIEYKPEQGVKFKFTNPKGFVGTHEFGVKELGVNTTEVSHIIKMKTQGSATLQWILFIRWLHDALAEDALDNIENYYSGQDKTSTWSPWVRFWRWIFFKNSNRRKKTVKPHNG